MALPDIVQTDPRLDQRRQLAMAMMQQGQSSAPVQHWSQGANRILQSLLGAYNMRQAEQEQQRQQGLGSEVAAQAMQEFSQPSQRYQEQGGTTVDYGHSIPSSGDATSRFAQVLAGSPYTQNFAQQAQQAQQAAQGQLGRQKELAEFKAQLGQRYPKPESDFDRYIKTLQGEKLQADVAKKKEEARQAGAAKGAEAYNIQTAADLAESLKGHASFKNIYGSLQGVTPSLTQGSVDAEAIRDQLGNILTLAARGQLKGQGQITEGETSMLRQAQTMLSNPRISDQAAATEVNRVINYLKTKGATGKESGGDENLQGRRSGRSDLRQSGPPAGFRLMEDANGNRAYVGPNGEIQEL